MAASYYEYFQYKKKGVSTILRRQLSIVICSIYCRCGFTEFKDERFFQSLQLMHVEINLRAHHPFFSCFSKSCPVQNGVFSNLQTIEYPKKHIRFLCSTQLYPSIHYEQGHSGALKRTAILLHLSAYLARTQVHIRHEIMRLFVSRLDGTFLQHRELTERFILFEVCPK